MGRAEDEYSPKNAVRRVQSRAKKKATSDGQTQTHDTARSRALRSEHVGAQSRTGRRWQPAAYRVCQIFTLSSFASPPHLPTRRWICPSDHRPARLYVLALTDSTAPELAGVDGEVVAATHFTPGIFSFNPTLNPSRVAGKQSLLARRTRDVVHILLPSSFS